MTWFSRKQTDGKINDKKNFCKKKKQKRFHQIMKFKHESHQSFAMVPNNYDSRTD